MSLDQLVRAIHIAMYGTKGMEHDFHLSWCIPMAQRMKVLLDES